ncbi:hypothetical protein KDL01_07940 [Actinospica durhamensis]|uniref:Uncharacterized protein n=1 Tax=Actinospica durhamensis TaxID=1508375 RepID=A0A941EKV2_9ACTN|nr:hypothetical protein [Actinospica durhamensis]MBR7833191.1 hypothetical protein [Actinospica durhamensis]
MSQTLILPNRGARAERRDLIEPTAGSSLTMHYQPHYANIAKDMHQERLRQAEAQRLRRAALRARRSLAGRLLG